MCKQKKVYSRIRCEAVCCFVFRYDSRYTFSARLLSSFTSTCCVVLCIYSFHLLCRVSYRTILSYYMAMAVRGARTDFSLFCAQNITNEHFLHLHSCRIMGLYIFVLMILLPFLASLFFFRVPCVNIKSVLLIIFYIPWPTHSVDERARSFIHTKVNDFF